MGGPGIEEAGPVAGQADGGGSVFPGLDFAWKGVAGHYELFSVAGGQAEGVGDGGGLKMYERKRYVARPEIEKLCYEPATFAHYMDSSDLERVVGYFVDELGPGRSSGG